VTAFLSDDWFALVQQASHELPEAEGAAVDLALTVNRRGADDVRAHLSIDKGRIVASSLADPAVAPLELACPETIAVAIVDGTTSVSVAFMRGELKVNGDMGAMHRLLPLTAEPGFVAMLSAVAAQTDF
jgi:hypothetical protein